MQRDGGDGGDGGGVRRCAVLGSPIAHSLSPVLHAAAYAHLGLPWVYERHEVAENGLAGFLAGLDDEWRGLSLTMPLKQVAIGLCDQVSDLARDVDAVNTVLREPGGRLTGDTTDVPGMAAALRSAGVGRDGPAPRAAVLGGGATARSAVAALAGLAGEVEVFVRTPARADDLLATAQARGVAAVVRPWSERSAALTAQVLVATTPKGGVDDLAAAVPAAGPAGQVTAARPAGPGVLLDVVYDPWPTALAAAWTARGGTVVSGLDFLVHQAALQVLAMTGRPVPVGVLLAAVAARR